MSYWNFTFPILPCFDKLEGYVDDIENSSWAIEAILQGKLPKEFTKYLYDRYHENFFTETNF